MSKNYNNMDNVNAIVTIPLSEDVNYAVQRFPLPAVRMQRIDAPFQNAMAAFAGETITYDPLNLDFLADEDGNARDDLMEWMVDIQNSNKPHSLYKDITVQILNRNKRPIKTYVFVGAHVTDIEQYTFDYTVVDTDVQLFSAMFAYQYYYRVK